MKYLSVSGLVIEGLEDGSTVDLPTLYSRQEIPADHELIPRQGTCLKWSPCPVGEKIPGYREGADIGSLLVVNCPRVIKPREAIPGGEEDPWAARLLGWGIIGLISKNAPKACFYVGTGQERRKLCHFANKTRTEEATYHQMQDVFDSGFFEQAP